MTTASRTTTRPRPRFQQAMLGGAAALALCLPQAALAMQASFTWAGIAPCEKISPAFTIADAPQGTERLKFTLHDKDAPHFHHGGSTIAYAGPKVPQGAITYIGPCPPGGQTHHYVWTVEALDGKDKLLAKTTVSGEFPMR